MLTVMIGAPGAGKSTLVAAKPALYGTVLSLDKARAALGSGEGDQAATPAAVALTRDDLHVHLRHQPWLPITLDATSAKPRDRATWLAIATEYGVGVNAVVVATPLALCLSRNAARPLHRRVPAEVVDRIWRQVDQVNDEMLAREGFCNTIYVSGDPSSR